MSSTSAGAPTITDWEAEQVQRANASGKTPVAFVHGLWPVDPRRLLAPEVR